MERDMDYEKNNIGYDWQYPEEGGWIKCKNYELCGEVLPIWWFECKGNYLCTNCHMSYGTWESNDYKHIGKEVLEFNDNIECPICLEIKRGISQPRCDHLLCIDCFKRCYYGDSSDEPIFPYLEIEDEYYGDQENPKWDCNYPLIKIYNEEWDKWDNAREEKYNNESYLKKCPLCRN
jgi:hypothetical protein